MKSHYLIVFVSICLMTVSAPKGLCKGSPREGAFMQETTGRVQTQEGEQEKKKQPQADKSASPRTTTKDGRKAEQIKWKLRGLGIASRVTVALNNGNERYGSIEQIGEDSFQLAEVDMKQVFTISYNDVKKVREGYGNPNQFTGKRWNPIWAKISLIAVVVLLVVVVPLSIPRT